MFRNKEKTGTGRASSPIWVPRHARTREQAHPILSRVSRASTFTIFPKWRACSQAMVNFPCKLLDVRPFHHLKARMDDDKVKTAIQSWIPGEKATKKWLSGATGELRFLRFLHYTMPWFSDMPVCFNCGVPCPECRTVLTQLFLTLEFWACKGCERRQRLWLYLRVFKAYTMKR